MAQPTLTPRAFAQKWGDNETKEKAASREHFMDIDQRRLAPNLECAR